MNKITVLIFASPKDKNFRDCLVSAKLVSEDIIIIYPNSPYVETVRQLGIKKAKSDLVLVLDADERITKELAQEIKTTINNQKLTFTHYRLPRKNIFAKKKWLRFGGWWPDYQIRLINKKYFVSWPKRIHSTPLIKGKTGYLKYPLLHYFHGDIQTMVNKTIVFEDIESNLLFKAGKKAATLTFFRKFIGELFRRLIKYLGFLDGSIGIIESIYQAFSKTITYLFLYEKKITKKGSAV